MQRLFGVLDSLAIAGHEASAVDLEILLATFRKD